MDTHETPVGHAYPPEQHRVEIVEAAGEGRVGPNLNLMKYGADTGRYTIEEYAEVLRLVGMSVAGLDDFIPAAESE